MYGFCSPNNENAGFYSRWNSAKTAAFDISSIACPSKSARTDRDHSKAQSVAAFAGQRFSFARRRVRCFFVAGFVRIRCDSVEGIRILTNPATLNTHHSQYQCHSISATVLVPQPGQDRSKPYRVSRCRIDPSGSAAECVSH